MRFARQLAGLRQFRGVSGCSLEIDPVHAAVARRHLDLAQLATAAEIWVGQLQDTLPRAVESWGTRSPSFVFMDQRGTTFHEDLAELERLFALGPSAQVAADNTLKPGSPVYLWHVAVGAWNSFITELWALEEFALHTIEDWQSVSQVL
mmetsp:Transcript_78414/g.181920  ORF Transcript_78414/g.181920 Transcript_78414/m.181920 type:complete len:149 (-) Transcript_78414:133-579(-)